MDSTENKRATCQGVKSRELKGGAIHLADFGGKAMATPLENERIWKEEKLPLLKPGGQEGEFHNLWRKAFAL